MEIFEDDRFLFDLNDRQKGLYLMLLGLAGKTNNMIRNEIGFIKARLNLKDVSISDLQTISKVFPKFILHNGYWKFSNFEEIHNYILGKSKGNPKELQRVEQKEKKKENKNKEVKICGYRDCTKQIQPGQELKHLTEHTLAEKVQHAN